MGGYIYTYIRDETSLEDAEESSGREERRPPREPELRDGDGAPDDELGRDPAVGTHPLGDELGRELGAEECQLEHRLPKVIVCERQYLTYLGSPDR